jgi:hypothetical protein
MLKCNMDIRFFIIFVKFLSPEVVNNVHSEVPWQLHILITDVVIALSFVLFDFDVIMVL